MPISKYAYQVQFLLLLITVPMTISDDVRFTPIFHSLVNIRTGQVSIVPIIGGLSDVSPNFTFLMAYSSPINSTVIISSTIGIVGYTAPTTDDFNANFTVYSISPSAMIVNLKVYGDMVLTFFSINYLVVSPQITYIELLRECFYCSNISNGTGPRLEERNIRTSFILGRLIVTGFFNGFQVSNPTGKTHILTMSSTQTAFSRNITSVFGTRGNNTVLSICYTVFVYKQPWNYDGKYLIQYYIGSQMLSSMTKPDSLGPGQKMDIFRDTDRMFFGCGGLSTTKTSVRDFFISTSSFTNLEQDYRANSGIDYVVMSVIMLAQRQQCVYTGDHTNPSTYANTTFMRATQRINFSDFTVIEKDFKCFEYDYYTSSTTISGNETVQSFCFHKLNNTSQTVQCSNLSIVANTSINFTISEYSTSNLSAISISIQRPAIYTKIPATRPETLGLIDCYIDENNSNNRTFCMKITLDDPSCSSDVTVDAYYDIDSQQCIGPYTCKTLGRIWSGDDCKPCHYSCLTCYGSLVTDCRTCSRQHYRYQIVVNATAKKCFCDDNYLDMYEYPVCLQCITLIDFCEDCAILEYALICTNCLAPFTFFNIITTKCQCPNGTFYMAPGICINTQGCTNYTTVSGNKTCTSCNSTLNFMPNVNNSSQCECLLGYYVNSTICLARCGDGILVMGEDCDDNNIYDGDGCSHNCTVQFNWTCNIIIMPSNCTLNSNSNSNSNTSSSLTAIVEYIRRKMDQNIMQMGIVILPEGQSLNESAIRSMLSHNISALDYDIRLQNGKIVLSFHYNESLEGKSLYLSINSSNITTYSYFDAVGMNAMLTYDSYSSHNKILGWFAIIIALLSLIVVFASIFIKKIIGIQLIQTVQAVLFLTAFIQSIPPGLSCLGQLQYSNGYNMYKNTDYTRTYLSDQRVSRIGIQNEFLISVNLMIVVVVICVVLILISKVVMDCYQRALETNINKFENFKKYRIGKKIYQFCFNEWYFVLCLMLCFPFVFAVTSQLKDTQVSYNSLYSASFNNFAIFMTFTMISVAYYRILIQYLTTTTLQHLQLKQFYTPFYTLSQFIIVLFISLGYSNSLIMVLIMVFVVLKCILILLLKPYKQKKHNFCLIFNQLCILMSLGIYLYVQSITYISQNQMMYVATTYLILVCLLISILWSIFRLRHYYRIQKQLEVENTIQQQYDVYITNQQWMRGNSQMNMIAGVRPQTPTDKVFTINQRQYGHPQQYLKQRQFIQQKIIKQQLIQQKILQQEQKTMKEHPIKNKIKNQSKDYELSQLQKEIQNTISRKRRQVF